MATTSTNAITQGDATMAAVATMASSGATGAVTRTTVAASAAVAATSTMAGQKSAMASVASTGATATGTTITNHPTTTVATMASNGLTLATDEGQTDDREEDRDPEQNETIHVFPPQTLCKCPRKRSRNLQPLMSITLRTPPTRPGSQAPRQSSTPAS
jgi:hypothetical protein